MLDPIIEDEKMEVLNDLPFGQKFHIILFSLSTKNQFWQSAIILTALRMRASIIKCQKPFFRFFLSTFNIETYRVYHIIWQNLTWLWSFFSIYSNEQANPKFFGSN